MKKLLLLFAAIVMTSTGLWADQKTVSYRYPVYHTEGDPTSGIKEWETEEIDATELTGSDARETLSRGWYVVTGSAVMYNKGLICTGDVHLILADGAKLTVTGDVNNAGIQVSGAGYSLTIYGQDNQLGQLVATGNIYAAGIGGGVSGSGSNIFIATNLAIKADNNNPPTTVIINTGADLASSLAGKQYVKIEKDLTPIKTAAIDEITEAIKYVTDEDIRAIANTAITDISNATTEDDINSIKTFALTKINAIAAITAARQGIKNTEINKWIDDAINDIQKCGQEATQEIDNVKAQILGTINIFQDGKEEALGPRHKAERPCREGYRQGRQRDYPLRTEEGGVYKGE